MNTQNAEPLNGIFAKSAESIAEYLSSHDRFSGGPAAGLRVLNVYLAYAGKRLSNSRRQRIERAKAMLTDRIRAADSSAFQAQYRNADAA